MREVAYRSLLEARRAGLHRAVARILEGGSAERLDESAALLAHHWEQAGDPVTAARWACRAAERLTRSSSQGAIELWRKVRTLLEPLEDDAQAAELDIAACVGLLYSGRYFGCERREGARLFEDGMRRARAAGDASALARMTASYGILHAQWGDAEGWHRVAEEASQLAEEVDDRDIRLEVNAPFALSLVVMGSTERSLEVVERELERAGDVSSFEVGSPGHMEYVALMRQQGFALAYLGRIDEAFAVLERGLELALGAGYASQVPALHQTIAAATGVKGDGPATVQHARRSLETADRIDSPNLRIGALLYIGRGHLINRDFRLAIGDLERAHALALEHGTSLVRDNLVLVALAEAHLALGEIDRAREFSALFAERKQGRAMDARGQLLEAQILLAARDLENPRVEQALDEAAARFEESRWLAFVPDVLLVRAELAGLRGDGAERTRHLRAACELYTGMGATGHAERVARELDR